MQTTIDRRNLIKGAGLAGLATAAAGMLAGSVAPAEESAPPTSATGPTRPTS